MFPFIIATLLFTNAAVAHNTEAGVQDVAQQIVVAAQPE